jgi:hypothetical protein
MRLSRIKSAIGPILVAAATLAVCANPLQAETSGKEDFEAKCAFCHGTDGKGHGVSTQVGRGIAPKDLTVLRRNNGGVFPTKNVYESIDGRIKIPSHARLDMPLYGASLQSGKADFTPAGEAEVKARIMRIVEYIKSIQEK